MLAASNQRIYNAYYDLANFYRDVLDDKKDAIVYFEEMLARFPNDQNKPAIYYSLYRLYSDAGDTAKADLYKNRIIKEFPETPFAKILTDPEYFKKIEDKDAELTNAYNAIFDLYDHKQYKEVISHVPELMKQYPGNKFSAQLYYLQTIAQGHFEQAGPFKDSLQQLVKIYPADKLVTPLAKQHLIYLAANDAAIQSRNTVLADVDPKEVPFTLAEENQKKAAYRPKPRAPLPYEQAIAEKKKELKEAAAIKALEKKQEAAKAADKPQEVAKAPDKQQEAAAAAILPPQPGKKDPASEPPAKHPYISALFNMRDSANYYFVVNVATGTTNLASSRFGIGQFNRANFTGAELKHQLLAVGDNNQLIYVGVFHSLNDVKKYAQQVVPVLGDIMKVPVEKYSYFIITKQNLDKLADKKTLDSYVDYYQNNY